MGCDLVFLYVFPPVLFLSSCISWRALFLSHSLEGKEEPMIKGGGNEEGKINDVKLIDFMPR